MYILTGHHLLQLTPSIRKRQIRISLLPRSTSETDPARACSGLLHISMGVRGRCDVYTGDDELRFCRDPGARARHLHSAGQRLIGKEHVCQSVKMIYNSRMARIDLNDGPTCEEHDLKCRGYSKQKLLHVRAAEDLCPESFCI